MDVTTDHFIFDLPDPSMELCIQPLQEPSFHVFPKLPIEMRFKIWGKTLPNGRKVKLIYRRGAAKEGFTYSMPPIAL
jgi:hypothetical protein